jgi:hypothetical protein
MTLSFNGVPAIASPVVYDTIPALANRLNSP